MYLNLKMLCIIFFGHLLLLSYSLHLVKFEQYRNIVQSKSNTLINIKLFFVYILFPQVLYKLEYGIHVAWLEYAFQLAIFPPIHKD